MICTGDFSFAEVPHYAPRMSGTLSSKIKAIREGLGLKQEEFADVLGTTQGTVSRWERGAKPDFEYLQAIADKGKTTVDALVTDGTPIPKRDSILVEPETETVRLQKLDINASMGPGTEIGDYVEHEAVTFDLRFLQAITRAPVHRLKLITGIGDSMYPTLNWGDTIMIDTTDNMLGKQDGLYWINIFGAAGLKRLRTVAPGRVLVKSDNPAVDDQEMDAADLRIEGRAVWFARGL
jgi:phage repressor protein C with HTH and peptisase S24 domain